MVVDLDSTNGTFVDEDRVSGEAPIAPGAVIRFGEVGVVFESTMRGCVRDRDVTARPTIYPFAVSTA